MLEEKTHLPAVLQSLGCIAETAMPVFETRESEIEKFIIEKILKRNDVCLSNLLCCDYLVMTSDNLFSYIWMLYSQKPGDNKKASWDDKSELCSLKVGRSCVDFILMITI